MTGGIHNQKHRREIIYIYSTVLIHSVSFAIAM